MNGNILFDKISDPKLQKEWHQYLAMTRASIEKLKEIRNFVDDDSKEFKYFEAVLEFIEARDQERTFFWDSFVRPGAPDKTFETEQLETEKTKP